MSCPAGARSKDTVWDKLFAQSSKQNLSEKFKRSEALSNTCKTFCLIISVAQLAAVPKVKTNGNCCTNVAHVQRVYLQEYAWIF